MEFHAFLTSAAGGVCGRLHASAALLPGVEPPGTHYIEAGWAPGRSGSLWRKRKSLPEIKLRFLAVQPLTWPLYGVSYPASLSHNILE
jgi:hypothetical protein